MAGFINHCIYIGLILLVLMEVNQIEADKQVCKLLHKGRETKGEFFRNEVLDVIQQRLTPDNCKQRCLDNEHCRSAEYLERKKVCYLFKANPTVKDTFSEKGRVIFQCRPWVY